MSQKPKETKEQREARRQKAREYHLKRVYGLTKEEFDALNSGVCPICLRHYGGTVKPCVDHDHHTGEIRGVICTYCNHRVVGRHRDPDLMGRVAAYLTPPFTGKIVPKKKRKRRKKK